ncbi:unnamed protein product [Bursaphelenchus okinawaensis]|uniref:C3H1-type domain-containing protein n=1 Tax=Bursaphelenchus okinawaensis TaxID=465554 RepID=A0A811JVB2_9BILA|nr:unnamed protein product [Bursaphelenchus okinawaensis]CAG9085513.1 unnamed protein product [Bursaphelenchus okinawaensis]
MQPSNGGDLMNFLLHPSQSKAWRTSDFQQLNNMNEPWNSRLHRPNVRNTFAHSACPRRQEKSKDYGRHEPAQRLYATVYPGHQRVLIYSKTTSRRAVGPLSRSFFHVNHGMTKTYQYPLEKMERFDASLHDVGNENIKPNFNLSGENQENMCESEYSCAPPNKFLTSDSIARPLSSNLAVSEPTSEDFSESTKETSYEEDEKMAYEDDKTSLDKDLNEGLREGNDHHEMEMEVNDEKRFQTKISEEECQPQMFPNPHDTQGLVDFLFNTQCNITRSRTKKYEVCLSTKKTVTQMRLEQKWRHLILEDNGMFGGLRSCQLPIGECMVCDEVLVDQIYYKRLLNNYYVEKICFDFAKYQTCRWGDYCKYSHDLSHWM